MQIHLNNKKNMHSQRCIMQILDYFFLVLVQVLTNPILISNYDVTNILDGNSQ